jgi:Asp-tRNA(Asn)/Glu-tRNA(Gln) amidotransferase A subunit family amidase
LEVVRERALERADEIDARISEIIARHPELDSGPRKTGEAWIPDQVRNDIEGEIGRLAGVPYVAKDNFLTTVGHTTVAAKILENFQSPLDATAIERLNAEGAVLIGKANLDSFAHGGSTENSAFGPTKNAVDDTRVAGGSSGGSAVVVAQGVVPFALGSDTGGSIRQPASFNGVVGYKPTYGMISRYGVVAMASSTDVVGPIARSVADVELLCEILSGQDGCDSTVFPNYFKLENVVKNTTNNKLTIDVYENSAAKYIDDHLKSTPYADEWIEESLKGVPKDAKMFEVGSASGREAKLIDSFGYDIQTSDVAEAFVKYLSDIGLNPMKFDLNADEFPEKYDYIFAKAVLVHFAYPEVEAILKKVFAALNENGIFAFTVKRGEGEEWKANYLGVERYFSYWSEGEIKQAAERAGFSEIEITGLEEPSRNNSWIAVVAKKVATKKLKIGLIKEFMSDGVDEDVKARTRQFVKKLTAAGHSVSEVSLPMVKYALPIYYIVVPAEISSNLARYDGVRYGARSGTAQTLAEVYGQSRDAGFVDENKRRLMIGSYVLSSGFFDAYYLQAQKARTLLIGEFNKLFDEYDFLIGPVAPTPAYKIGENIDDPIKMYLADIMTVPASLAGLPAISLPNGADKNGLPIGVQIIGQMKDDARLLEFAKEMNDV